MQIKRLLPGNMSYVDPTDEECTCPVTVEQICPPLKIQRKNCPRKVGIVDFFGGGLGPCGGVGITEQGGTSTLVFVLLCVGNTS